MEKQLVIMSTITYLLLFNNSITFRLTRKNNFWIMIIILLHMSIVYNYIGNFCVMPMFAILLLYIGWLKKEDSCLNIFLVICAYMLIVILDYLMHLFWSFIGWTSNTHWWMYILIAYPIYVAVWRWMVKKVTKINRKNYLLPPEKVIVILIITIVVGMCIFVLNVEIIARSGSTLFALFCGIVLYIAYFLLTFIMIMTIVKEYKISTEIKMKQHSYDNLQEYIVQIETLYQSLRSFKHDYVNIMVSIAGFIEADDMIGLKNYYEKQILPVSVRFVQSEDTIARLHYLDLLELKSLISVKLNYALELNIEVILEIAEKIDKINMKSLDLVRVVGILLDNAIEACQACEVPRLVIGIIKLWDGVIVIIKNTYVKQNMDYSRLGSIGISSKGERRGIGLYNVKLILSQYQNVMMNTEYAEQQFIQEIIIYDKLPESEE